MELSDTQMAELQRLKAYFPYRIIYAALNEAGDFESGAVVNKRIPNEFARNGYKVWILQ